MILAGQRYQGHISAANVVESQQGTIGIELTLEAPEGSIQKTLWVTPKSREHVLRTLGYLGVSEEQAQSATFLENLDSVLIGRPCSFTTEETEYKGKKRTEVQWINEPRKAPTGNVSKRAAALFGGTVPLPEAPPITDDDVPF